MKCIIYLMNTDAWIQNGMISIFHIISEIRTRALKELSSFISHQLENRGFIVRIKYVKYIQTHTQIFLICGKSGGLQGIR